MSNRAEKTPLRVAIQTYGCRSNYADTVDLQASLTEEGAVPCSIDSDADVYVINTCTVTNSADQEALKTIRKLRRRSPDAKIVVTGCMAEARGEELRALDEIDSVLGPGRRHALVDSILDRTGASNPQERASKHTRIERRVKKSLPERYSISLEDPLSPAVTGPAAELGESTLRSRYHLRIQEGCENSCTFCIIPSTRGRLSSRPPEMILEDLAQLRERGFREVVLTGTHIGGYGEDIGTSFLELLRRIVRESATFGLDGLRIRLSSIDPNDLPLEMLELVASEPLFCEHLHICFQAFSDSVLKRMNRRYSLGEAVDLVLAAKKFAPDMAIGTDIITGFPCETEQMFQESLSVFDDLGFSYLHVFPYSERSGTAATQLSGIVSPQERKRRAARWRSLAERSSSRFSNRLAGDELEVVAERITDKEIKGTSREFQSCVWSPEVDTQDGSRRSSAMAVHSGEIYRLRAMRYDEKRKVMICQ